VFGAVTRIEFGADFDGIVCRASDLEKPIPAADPVLAAYARRWLDELARGAGREALGEQVRQLVRTLLPSGRCTVERVAASLGVDRRTVHRHLAREGTTFSGVVVDARRALVERYVASGERPLSDVAELLGFSTQSAFAGWFKAQYGCSATAWRAAGGGTAGVGGVARAREAALRTASPRPAAGRSARSARPRPT
jgi:AraC-like DNA-binding protein